mgnify:CR=1 FL=1
MPGLNGDTADSMEAVIGRLSDVQPGRRPRRPGLVSAPLLQSRLRPQVP